MNLSAGSRVKFTVSVVTTFNPTGSTIDVSVDDVWHPATWQAVPIPNGSEWSQSAVVDDWFAGPDVATGDVAGATVLTAKRHEVKVRVVNGGQRVVFDAGALDVK